MARWLKTCRSLLGCSGSIQCSIRFGMIRASKNLARQRRNNRVGRLTTIGLGGSMNRPTRHNLARRDLSIRISAFALDARTENGKWGQSRVALIQRDQDLARLR